MFLFCYPFCDIFKIIIQLDLQYKLNISFLHFQKKEIFSLSEKRKGGFFNHIRAFASNIIPKTNQPVTVPLFNCLKSTGQAGKVSQNTELK